MIAPGKLVEVITHLEMTERPALPDDAAALLRRVENPDLGWYRALFRKIGEPWLWFARLMMDDEKLSRVLGDPAIEVYVLEEAGEEIGITELDRSVPGVVEFGYFGLAPGATGRGIGMRMMQAALAHAWTADTRRVWLHTCQFDHPAALGFYRRAGFTPYATTVEIGDDPRLAGVLATDAAPHVALIRPMKS
jgi:GNAT superfamily N-acetyltransferase